MIKKEFKKGNYVKIRNNEIDENEKSIINDKKEYKILDINDEYAKIQFNEITNVLIRELNPIKISLEHISRLTQFSNYIEEPTVIIYTCENLSIDICIYKNGQIILKTEIDNKVVEHLHQLQNVFYDITGEELEFK